MNTKELLVALTEADAVGGVGTALAVIEEAAQPFAAVKRQKDGSLLATVKGKTDTTVIFEAHFDQIGFMVTEVIGGFLRIAAVGGLDARHLPATRVKIYGKEVIPGVITSVPHHLKDLGAGDGAPKLEQLFVDTGLADASALVSVGDRVVFAEPPCLLSDNVITAPSLDNRAGCAALLLALERIAEQGEPPVTVSCLFTDKEELGMRGAATAAFGKTAEAVIAVDVSFGDTPGVPPEDTGRMGDGGMIGLSPVLDRRLSDRLKSVAAEVADCQFEVMGRRTGTDADVLSTVGDGLRTALVSVPLRNMHTGAEVVWLSDVEAVADLLAGYVLRYEEER